VKVSGGKFLTLKGEQRLRFFENRALKKIFGPKRDEVTGGCKGTT
jgi:hypothetical protein